LVIAALSFKDAPIERKQKRMSKKRRKGGAGLEPGRRIRLSLRSCRRGDVLSQLIYVKKGRKGNSLGCIHQ